jgi:hypothetical protein
MGSRFIQESKPKLNAISVALTKPQLFKSLIDDLHFTAEVGT